jgi:hypothetical protein
MWSFTCSEQIPGRFGGMEQTTEDSNQLPVTSWQLAIGNWQLENRK